MDSTAGSMLVSMGTNVNALRFSYLMSYVLARTSSSSRAKNTDSEASSLLSLMPVFMFVAPLRRRARGSARVAVELDGGETGTGGRGDETRIGEQEGLRVHVHVGDAALLTGTGVDDVHRVTERNRGGDGDVRAPLAHARKHR